ncbi:MAG: DUF3392 domain-containing protein [Natronospirillum sp.]|uniref:DUF3392 family protein n=1 Tax=Natronospirillum sp. TaxID=2812955 RepID=UPI0025D1B572|nr:DUF3392 family protein [Natronospirillum sp.]MCH8551595.1 DUF3392 domain-containing protein [Natronospirillum sp.]
MSALLLEFSGLFQPHLTFLSTGLVASLLVIFGHDINRAVRGLVRKAHFVLRTLVFVILCALGYGFMTVQGGLWVARALSSIDAHFLGIIIVLAFLAVGYLAERRSA